MLKNIKIKISLVYIILLVLLIAIQFAQFNNILNIEQGEIREKFILINIILFVTFLALGVIIFNVLISPVTKLIKVAEQIACGEEIQIKPISDGNKDEVDYIATTFNTINSELKENLNEVLRKKMQMEKILLHLTDGIIAFNKKGEILHINPAATTLLKLSSDDTNFQKVFSKLKINIDLEQIMYLENLTSYEQRLNIQDKNVNLFFVPYKDEQEIYAGIIVVIQDITEHVKLDNMRKEFIANVSHELKTPITSIMGYAETLLDEDYEKEIKDKFLKVIANEGKRMAKLVNDLLMLSKYDSKELKNQKVEFDLGELVKTCKESLDVEIEKKKQDVECFVTANVPPVYADKDGIERVVLNILTNSIKYTHESGKIKIYVGFVYNDAYIKIIDTGIGIPRDDLNRVFERFYRVDKARTREMGGTGLGLSIAKEILEKNEGSIDIKSVYGKGTEVVIKIPTIKEKKSDEK